MTPFHSQRGYVARLFESLRLQRGLRPGELAARLGAANPPKVGGLIRCFELGGSISDHWLQMLIAELQPDPAELIRCAELDEAEQRQTWEAWANEPIDPFLTIRYMPAVIGAREVPRAFCNSREEAEGWAARELKRFGAKGYLNWSRRERTWYDRCGVNPRRRHTVTYKERALGAWMQLGGSQRKFLLGPAGEVITQGYGLNQPSSSRS